MILDPATLDRQITSVTARALARGVLEPIPTRVETIQDGGVPYQVRVLRLQLERKQQARSREVPGFNPFLPPDPDLLVGDVSSTHVCVLNKFNVLERHVLIVTRAFEDQESPLTAADFDALAWCLTAIDGVAFYNAGVVAGASQPHKHLQLVPALCPDSRAPIEAVLAGRPSGPRRRDPGAPFVGAVPHFAFPHAVSWFEPDVGATTSARLLSVYRSLLAALDCLPPDPYNLLATRAWMMLVPRSREHFGSISINALGFAGSLFVRDDAELATLRSAGPSALLRHVARDPR